MRTLNGQRLIAGAAGALILILLAAALMACHDTPDRSRVISFAPRVSCCEFRERDVCHDESALSLERPDYVAQKDICFKHGECFTGCPPEDREDRDP